MTSQDLLAQLRAAIAEGAGEKAVVDIAEQIVAAGIDAKAAIDVAAEAIRTVGDRFEAGDIFLPELMIAGKTMERCLAVLKPHLKVQEGARKTGRVVVVHEAHRSFGPGAEIVSRLIEKSFWYLEAPVKRVTGFDVIFPLFAREQAYLPGVERILTAARDTLAV